MKQFLLILAVMSLTACGADTMSAAATAAALKKQEAEQGKQTMDQFQRKLKDSTARMEQHAQETAEAAGNN